MSLLSVTNYTYNYIILKVVISWLGVSKRAVVYLIGTIDPEVHRYIGLHYEFHFILHSQTICRFIYPYFVVTTSCQTLTV